MTDIDVVLAKIESVEEKADLRGESHKKEHEYITQLIGEVKDLAVKTNGRVRANEIAIASISGKAIGIAMTVSLVVSVVGGYIISSGVGS